MSVHQGLIDESVEGSAQSWRIGGQMARQVLHHQNSDELLLRVDEEPRGGRAAPAELSHRAGLSAARRIEHDVAAETEALAIVEFVHGRRELAEVIRQHQLDGPAAENPGA